MSVAKFLLPFVIFTAVLSSCNKEEDTIAKVYVYNMDHEPVVNALVKLIPDGDVPGKTRVAEKSAVTNASGVAVFDFTEEFKPGQAGVAVLSIEVNGVENTGIIKIVEETTSEETVFL